MFRLLPGQALNAGNARMLYRVGYDLARSAQQVAEGQTERAPAEQDERRQYCDLAMETLRQAVAAGYRDRAGIEKDPALAVLRSRADFNTLLAKVSK